MLHRRQPGGGAGGGRELGLDCITSGLLSNAH